MGEEREEGFRNLACWARRGRRKTDIEGTRGGGKGEGCGGFAVGGSCMTAGSSTVLVDAADAVGSALVVDSSEEDDGRQAATGKGRAEREMDGLVWTESRV